MKSKIRKEKSPLEELFWIGLKTFMRLRLFFYFLNFKKRHIWFEFERGRLKIRFLKHEDFIKLIKSRLANLKKLKRGLFLTRALSEALGGCNFIIFWPKKNKNRFVQFWTGKGRLEFNFYANKRNGLDKYYYPLLGLLAEKGYARKEAAKNKKKVFKLQKGYQIVSIDVDFGREIIEAAEFINLVYKKIYKISLADVNFSVG